MWLPWRWHWGPQFHFFFIFYVLKMDVKFVFLQLSKGFLQSPRHFKSNTKLPRRHFGLLPQPYLYCPSDPRDSRGMMFCKQIWLSVTLVWHLPSSLNPVTKLQSLSQLVSEDWGKEGSEYLNVPSLLSLNQQPAFCSIDIFPFFSFLLLT